MTGASQAGESSVETLPDGTITGLYRSDVQRKRAELRDIRQRRESSTPPAPPLSRLVTTSSDIGAAASAANRITPLSDRETPRRVTPQNSSTITGPSFLGLSEPEPARNPDLAYLYEDDLSDTGHRRKWIAVVIVIAIVGFGGYELRQNPSWQSGLNSWARQVTNRKPSSVSPRVDSNSEISNAKPQTDAPPAPVASNDTSGASGTQQQKLDTTHPATSSQTGTAPDSETRSKSESATPDLHQAGASPNSAAPERLASTRDDSSEETSARKQLLDDHTQRDQALVMKAEDYLYGRGVPKNCDQALVFLHAAADRGNAAARSKLGGLYATGNCVPLDRARAYNWFALARQSGDRNVWIERNIGMLWVQMTPEERASAVRTHR